MQSARRYGNRLGIAAVIGAWLLCASFHATAADPALNLAAGLPVRFLPRQESGSVTRSLTDGQTTVGEDALHFERSMPNPLFYLDLERVETVGEVRLHVSMGRNPAFIDAWLHPKIDLFAGETWDTMRRVAGYDPIAERHLAWQRKENHPLVFDGLQVNARHVVLVADHVFQSRGMRFAELEVFRGPGPALAPAPAEGTLTLEEIWTQYASNANVESFDPSHLTPHIPWAKPMSGPPIRALFLIGRGAEREVAEILQRLPMEADLLRMDDTSGGYPQDELALNFILEKSFLETLRNQHDVIVLGGNLYWLDLTAAVRERILEKVAVEGSGLLYVNPWAPRLDPSMERILSTLEPMPTDGLLCPFDPAVPVPVPDDLLREGVLGQGRVLALMLGEALQPPLFNRRFSLSLIPRMRSLGDLPNHSDLYFALLAKTIRRSAGRESPQRLAAIDVREAGPDGLLIDLVVNNAGGALDGKLTVELRDPDFRRVHTQTRRLALPAGEDAVVRMELAPDAPLRPGEQVVSVFLRDGKGHTLDWGNVIADVTGPGIKVLRLYRDAFAHGETVTGRLRTHLRADADEVVFHLVDSEGRLCAEQRVRLGGGGRDLAEFSLESHRVLGLAAHVEARLLRHGLEVDRRHIDVPLGVNQMLSGNRFTGYRWPVHSPHIPWHTEFHRLERQAGMDGGLGPERAARLGMRGYVLPVYSRGGLYGVSGPTPDDLADPATWNLLEEQIHEALDRWLVWGVTDYSIGDETVMHDPQSEIMQRAFQGDLRERFEDDLDRLNKAWGTAFAAFEDIPAPRRTDVNPDRHFTAASINPWFAYRTFLDDLFMGPVLRGQQVMTQRAPGTRLGLDGINNLAANNTRWYELMQGTDHLIYYESNWLAAPTARSFRRPGQYIASWSLTGYDVGDGDELLAYHCAWKELLRGFNGVALWGGPGGHRYTEQPSYRGYRPYHGWSLLQSDLSMRRTGRIFSEEILEIKQGIGKLLINASPVYDVGVHFSAESLLSSVAAPGPWRPWGQSWWWHAQVAHELRAVTALLDDAGLAWRFLAAPQVEKGDLCAGKYQLFVMAMSAAVSREEAEALRRYVEGGGTLLVLGDYGILDREGRFWEENPLDALTGVSSGKSLAQAGPYARGRMPGIADPPLWIADPELRVTDGMVTEWFNEVDGEEVHGTPIPAVVEKRHGAGRVITFNGYFFEYRWSFPRYTPGPLLDKHSPAERAARGYRGILRQLLDRTPARPLIEVHDPSYPEPLLPYAELRRFAEGEATYYGILEKHFRTGFYVVHRTRNEESTWRSVRVRFPEAAHLYDVRARKYLGFTDSVETSLGACVAKVFAALPYRVAGLQVLADSTVFQGGELRLDLAVDTGEAAPATHSVLVRLYDPAGREVEAYGGPVLLPDGQGQARFILALDDPSGAWRVTAMDTVSGEHAATAFTVKAR